jgi:hypothetical protein
VKHKARRKRQPDPAALLASLASALNRCERAGLHPELTLGIAVTEQGIVMPVKGKWAVRMLRKR